MKFKYLSRGALTNKMKCNNQVDRREARKQYAIWQLIGLGASIISGSFEFNTIQFEVDDYKLQFHPVHGKWFVINHKDISGRGISSLRICILHINEKGGLPMPQSPTLPDYSDRLGFHITKIDNGYYISGYGINGDFATYRATSDEMIQFVHEMVQDAVPKLTLVKPADNAD